MQNNEELLDEYKIVKSLGTGYSGIVKLAINKEDNKEYALKILNKKKPNFDKLVDGLRKEAKILTNLQHPNIVKFYKFTTEGVHTRAQLKEENVCYTALEVAKNGEVFDILFESGAFSENLTRYYVR